MFRTKNSWAMLLTAALLPVFGLVLDSRVPAFAACDNACRERQEHYFTGSGPYIKYSITSCLSCNMGTALCWIKANENGAGECRATGQNIVRYYDDGNALCPLPGTFVVEAEKVNGEINSPLAIDGYKCLAAP